MEVKLKIDDRNGGWIWKDYRAEDIRFKKSVQPEHDDKDDDSDEL